ncbi:MAG TPA: DUF3486 family protein [Nitrospira sp.]|nr:DUF3486 family protein [Nitrospira sp.]
MRKTVSKVDKLGVRDLVNQLFEANASYADITAAVAKETGQAISDSALSRYRKHWDAQRASEEAMEQQLDRLTSMLKADPDLDLKQGALALFWKKLIQRMADAEASFADADMVELSHLLLKAKRLDQTTDALAIQRERLELVKQKASQAAAKVEQELQTAGVSRDKIVEMVDEILGVAA